MRSTPWILWRSVFLDTLRLVALAATVLVTVIAFAAAVRPITEGRLTPVDALKFLVLAMPPMLAYALPFAGGFAATLVYHRLAQDNEMIAARASGLSLRVLLAPALGIGLLLSVSLAALNEQVIPRFLRGMQELVTADLARILTTSVERGRSVELNRTWVYADRAAQVPPATGSGVRAQVVMSPMAAIELSPEGEVLSDITASRATLWIVPGDRVRASAESNPGGAGASGGASERGSGGSVAVMRLEGVAGSRAGQGMISRADLDLVFPVAGGFNDDPKFLTWRELSAATTNPEMMNWVEDRRRDLAYHLAARRALNQIRDALVRDRTVDFTDGVGGVLTLRGGGIAWADGRWAVLPAPGQSAVIVERAREGAGTGAPAGGGVDRSRLSGERAYLTLDLGEDRARRRMEYRLLLESVRVEGTGEGSTRRAEMLLTGLRAPQFGAEDLLDAQAWPSARLINELAAPALAPPAPDESLRGPTEELQRTIADLRREVLSKRHERLALAVSCCVMVLAGALTAVRLSDRLPLVSYAASFFPALASIITIAGGQQMTHAAGPVGLLLLWGGVGVIGLYALAMYVSVARH